MKILIVDDSQLFITRFSQFLRDHNHDVIECLDANRCFDMYKHHQPDILFLDILMPGIDGFSCMRSILKEFPKAKIIVISSMGQQTKIIEAIQNGATDFINKPFDPGKVILAIEKIEYN